jgi:hypothetical protein
MYGGEFRFGVYIKKSVGGKKAPAFVKFVVKHFCLPCAVAGFNQTLKIARMYRRQMKRKMRTDKALYATRALGVEFEEQAAATVRKRLDKIIAHRHNTKVRIEQIRAAFAAENKRRTEAMDAAASEEDKCN